MKNGDYYKHFKGDTYYFCGIALPLKEYVGRTSQLIQINEAFDAHTPQGQPIQNVQLFTIGGVLLIDKDTPHVVYQAEKDYETDNVWIREVDEFFGYKEENQKLIKRFERLPKQLS